MFANVRFYLFLLFFLLSSPFFLIPMALSESGNARIRQFWSRLFLRIFQIRIRIEGEADPDAGIFAPNHRSFADIVIFEAARPAERDICWIAKSQLMRLPVVGWMLKAGRMVTVERENKRGLIKLVKEIHRPLERGRPLVIFPEGHRSRKPGLLPFKGGAKFIAEHHRLPIQPIVLAHSDDRVDTNRRRMTPGTVVLRYLPLRKPEGESWFADMEEEMNRVYTQLTDRSTNN